MLKRTSIAAGWGCALACLLCLLIVNPRADIGLNDDWSYIFSANRLAQTGHIAYNGWAAPILGVQLYLGALFIRLFGFSFTVVRATSMVAFLLSAVLAHTILLRCGVRARNAVLGTLTLMLSPLYLGLATTFMSDGLAMLFILLFFYAAVRANDAASGRATLLWLVMAALSGVAGGSVRQIAFLCNLAALPMLVWHLRRRRGVVAAGAMLWIAAAASVLLMVRWFNRQPNTAIEKPYFLPSIHGQLLGVWMPWVIHSVVSCLLLASPMLLALALRFPARVGKSRLQLLAMLSVIVATVAALSWKHGGAWWGGWLIGNYVTTTGGVQAPDVMQPQQLTVPPFAQIAVALFLIITTAVAAWTVVRFTRQPGTASRSEHDRLMLAMAVPFTAGYLLLVFTRFSIFDRYFLPLLFLGILFALRWFERRFDANISFLVLLPLCVMAAFGIAATHDMFAGARARIVATDELRAAGIARNNFRGGFEYDGWTEVATEGHVNEPRIHPSSAYHPFPLPAGLDHVHPAGLPNYPCYSFFFHYTPSIREHYILQGRPDFCFSNAPAFAPIHFRTWLPPHDHTIYIAQVPPQFW